MCFLNKDNVTLKTQEARGPHHSPAIQFKSINTFAQSNDYTIALSDKQSSSPFESSMVDYFFKKNQSALCKDILRQAW